jgi:hypothetical protein
MSDTLCKYFYSFAIFLSGEIGKHIYLLQTLLYFSNPEQKRDELDLCQFYWKNSPIFRGFIRLVSVSTKEESSLKLIIFAMSFYLSRFEWQVLLRYEDIIRIRQYAVFWVLKWVYNAILWTQKFPGLIIPIFQYFWYEMTNLLDFGSKQ